MRSIAPSSCSKERGAKTSSETERERAFHCALMKPAQDRLAADLQAIAFSHLSVPLITNADARPIADGGEARQSLIRQFRNCPVARSS